MPGDAYGVELAVATANLRYWYHSIDSMHDEMI